jgi:type IV pilus assembly protein PilM
LFKFDQNKVVGLDIGTSALKMVELTKDNTGYTVNAAAMLDITAPPEDNKNSHDRLTEALHECIEITGTQANSAVCSVCGPEVTVRNFKFPLLPKDEVDGAVVFEASQVCPFDISNGTVDYQIVPGDKKNINGILVAATNSLIDKKRQVAQTAPFNNIMMDIDGLALINCFNELEKDEKGKSVAILNVGSSFVNLAIIGNDSLPFVRDMLYAGNDIIRYIANEKEMSVEDVEKIVLNGSDDETSDPEFDESMEKACRKLIIDVDETLRYHRTHIKSDDVEKIFVCGGFAMVKGFIEILNDWFPAEVVLWNPFDKIRRGESLSQEKVLQENGPALAVATGLAMRTI